MPLIISLQTCLIVFTNNFPCCLTILQLHCISYIQYKKSLISSFIKISFLLSFLFHSLPIPLQIFQIQFILLSDNLQLHLLLHIQYQRFLILSIIKVLFTSYNYQFRVNNIFSLMLSIFSSNKNTPMQSLHERIFENKYTNRAKE